MARGFDQCVKDTTVTAIEKAKTAGTLNGNDTVASMYYGRCEWIDYDRLKKGIQKSSKSKGAQEKVVSLQALVSVVGLGMLVVGSGLF